MKNVFPVPEQTKPDGNFPTVKAPNPEDPNAFTLAFKLAEEKKADVIIGTDPDSDRLGVAVRKHDGTWAVLTGNQIGSILLYCLLTAKKEAGILPQNGLVVKSLVSTPLADAICASFGVDIREVLTGFRFISEQIAECEAKHEHTFLFGFEESFGFLAGGFSRDKDAICAAMLVAEGCTLFKEQGLTLYDVLQKIYATYGYYKEKTVSYTLEGKAGIEKIQGAMKKLQADPPKAIGGQAVVKYVDYNDSAATGLPKSNVLRWTLADGSWAIARPSGTEPKLKIYSGVRGASDADADSKLAALSAAMDELLKPYLA